LAVIAVARRCSTSTAPEQLRQAAKLLERENERLIRQVLELKQKLASAEGKRTEQLELLAELEQQLAARNRKLFGDSSEKRGSEKAPREKTSQAGHGPREQPTLPVVEREHVLDEAYHACPSCGGDLAAMAGQFEDSEEVDVLERQFVLVATSARTTGAPAVAASRPRWVPTSSSPAGATRPTSS
jgi:transposase